MPKDFNQSTSLESYLKLQLVYSNTSTITIRTLYVSIKTLTVYNCSTCCFIPLLGQITVIVIQFVRLAASFI